MWLAALLRDTNLNANFIFLAENAARPYRAVAADPTFPEFAHGRV